MSTLFVLGITQPVLSQTQLAGCVPPLSPFPPEAQYLADYRAEIIADHERFFREIRTYITCLDSERNKALAITRETVQTLQDALAASEENVAPVAAHPGNGPTDLPNNSIPGD